MELTIRSWTHEENHSGAWHTASRASAPMKQREHGYTFLCRFKCQGSEWTNKTPSTEGETLTSQVFQLKGISFKISFDRKMAKKSLGPVYATLRAPATVRSFTTVALRNIMRSSVVKTVKAPGVCWGESEELPLCKLWLKRPVQRACRQAKNRTIHIMTAHIIRLMLRAFTRRLYPHPYPDPYNILVLLLLRILCTHMFAFILTYFVLPIVYPYAYV